MNKSITSILLIALAASLFSAVAAVNITISGKVVTLENDLIKVTYSGDVGISTWIIKKTGTDISGRKLDDSADRPPLSDAKIINDGADSKTVQLWWSGSTSKVTITNNSPVLKIEYIKMGHVFEWGKCGTVVIHGAKEWQQKQGWSKTYPGHKESSYYRGEWGNPGPLVYNGWFIGGVYGSNGAGFGRMMQWEHLNVIKLMDNCGFEFFKFKGGAGTGHLFAVIDGAEEILSLGKRIADEPSIPQVNWDNPTALTVKKAVLAGSGYQQNRLHQVVFGMPDGRRDAFDCRGKAVPFSAGTRATARGMYVLPLQAEENAR